MEDPFDYAELQIRQPVRLLPGRASYEIFGDRKRLVAIATEVEGRSVLDKIARLLPDSRMLMVTTAAGEPMMTLAYQGAKWLVEVTEPDDSLVGKIRIGGSRRHYTLLDAEGTEIAQVTGDLAVRRFTVTGTNRPPFAEVKKTFAGPVKEALTSSDHYTVKFVLQPRPLERTLTVLMPIVIDLARYGPS
ncbi:MAG TPA: phospholipid scramblase-related protein [Trebonia sp.]|nr:phospholipid scramblase-related protein [Trebonia sp.]